MIQNKNVGTNLHAGNSTCMAIYFGIDLSGPANHKDTSLAVFNDYLNSICLFSGQSDKELLEKQQIFKPLAIGIDAPLSYQDGGGYRSGDLALRAFLNVNGFSGLGVMAPTYNRMVYLTLRGITLANLFRQESNEVFLYEVHPGGYLAVSGYPYKSIQKLKDNCDARNHIFEELVLKENLKVGPRLNSDHDIMAMACALAVREQQQNKNRWCFDQTEDQPFPIIC